LPALRELEPTELGEDVDPKRRKANLKNNARLSKLFRSDLPARGPESLESRHDAPGILQSWLDPQVKVARSARTAMQSESVRANYQKPNFMRGERL
jgi:hypothetical protein